MTIQTYNIIIFDAHNLKRLLQCNIYIIYIYYLSLSLVFETLSITFRGLFAKIRVTGVLLQICFFCYIVTRGKSHSSPANPPRKL